MKIPVFKKLYAEGLISEESLRRVEDEEARSVLSLYWELRLLLYLGVVLLTGGLGILVYKHIDTIGHQAVLAFIALVTAGCFYYCLRNRAVFSWEKVAAPNGFFDYVLLLGCLSLLIFLGYLQYEYDVFGQHYGTATFIPMLILFWAAYYFDHQGILSLAITNLAAWAGVAITPLSILHEGNFDDDRLIYTGLLLGAFLLVMGGLSRLRGLKAHFETTYSNFGLHMFFIAGLAGLFRFSSIYFLWFLVLGAIAFYLYTEAMKRRSFYFVLVIALYFYIALAYVVCRLIMTTAGNDVTGPILLGLLYFIFSAFGVIRLLIHANRQIKNHDSL